MITPEASSAYLPGPRLMVTPLTVTQADVGLGKVSKRCLDIVVALAVLALAALPMLCIALAIRLTSPGPVLFRQLRVGKGGRLFTMYKFRSMYQDAELRLAEVMHLNEAVGPIFKIRNDPRVTPIGRWLRRTSLDELPQLFNVLRGEMSLVGPRPPLMREVLDYEPWHLERLTVKPGITGLWQVSGRSNLPFQEMMRLDIEYVIHWSLWLDLRLLALTIVTVLSGRGAC